MTVRELLAKAGMTSEIGQVKWGNPALPKDGGIYVVSLSPSASKNMPSTNLEYNDAAIEHWIESNDDFTIDGEKATAELLKSRLSEFWLPLENILYVGATIDLARRVRELFHTEIGMPSPHSGGQWLKCLNNLDETYVYYACVESPSYQKKKILEHFSSINGCFPFANLGGGKCHGLKCQRKK